MNTKCSLCNKELKRVRFKTRAGRPLCGKCHKIHLEQRLRREFNNAELW